MLQLGLSLYTWLACIRIERFTERFGFEFGLRKDASAMRTLKIGGIAFLGLWMSLVTWMVWDADYHSRQACFYAAAAALHESPPAIGGGCPIYR